ncbi:MAG: hypothetical protein KGJ62_01065 [Armatimonadetes bacterium]|nr:hypothetical protein [Armatimonadota bacterium]MDE2207615.1 hypothetical protein [Armatimonadota bacterium]
MGDEPVDEPAKSVEDGENGRRIAFWSVARRIAAQCAICLLLFAAAVVWRWHFTRGDLWLDEADYATAATRSLDANRWDTSHNSARDSALIALRHFHPPFASEVLMVALKFGADERTLRIPAVVFGALSVVLVYLCGLEIFRGRRILSFACAAIVIVTPACVRAASHALPWSYITFWLLLDIWGLVRFCRTPNVIAMGIIGVSLGGMLCTSEMFFPQLLGTGLAAPFVFAIAWRSAGGRAALARGLALGALSFVLVSAALFPAGLLGGTYAMLHHYMVMAHDEFPVSVGRRVYDRAPKWSYLYWYWHGFRWEFVWYVAAIPGALVLAARRRLTAGHGALAAMALTILGTSEAAHILGPEYLCHVLPMLTLLGGLLVEAVSDLQAYVGSALAVAWMALCAVQPGSMTLAGMDVRSRMPRWAAASRFLAARWKQGDYMLAPAYASVGRWYMLHYAGAKAQDWQIEALPSGRAPARLLSDMRDGLYKYAAVGSTFSDTYTVDWRISILMRHWKEIWHSDEHGTGISRLTLFEIPPGVSSRHPLWLPPVRARRPLTPAAPPAGLPPIIFF